MKILVAHNIFRPQIRGGAEVVVDNIVYGLKKRGQEIVVVTVGQKKQTETIDGVKVFRLPCFNLFNFFELGQQPLWRRFFWHVLDVFNFWQARQIYQILRQEKPDLVLAHNLKGLGFLTPLVIRLLKLKNIQTVHDMQLLHPAGLLPDDLSGGWGVRCYGCLCRLLFASPRAVVFPSAYLQSVYDGFGFFSRSWKLVWANPVAGPLDRQSQTPARPARQLLFLGQVERYKGILPLLEALSGLTQEVTLNVVGDGQALSEAKILAQKLFPEGPAEAAKGPRVRFWGRLGQSDLIEKIWPQIDILINPSQTGESFGLVVAEAQTQGVPAIVSDRGALPELVADGRTGWVVESRGLSEQQFAVNLRKTLAKCLERPEQLLAMRKNCLATAQEYSLENYLNKLEELAKMS